MSIPDESILRDATPSEQQAIARLNALGGYLSSPLPPGESHPGSWIVRVWHPHLPPGTGVEASAGSREVAITAAVDGLDKALGDKRRPRPVPKPTAKAKPKGRS